MNKETKLIDEAYERIYLEEDSKYIKDTIKYIDGLLKDNEYSKESKSFLEGIRDFAKEKNFLTRGQIGALGNFAKGSPVKIK